VDERGFAVPIALAVLLIALLLMFAAVLSSVSAVNTSERDLNAKLAFQGADTALRQALYEANGLALDASQLVNPPSLLGNSVLPGQCVVSSGINAPISNISHQLTGGNWCTPIRGDLGDGVSYCYQVSPVVTLWSPGSASLNITYAFNREIYATGTAGGVARKLYEQITATGQTSGISVAGVTVLGGAGLSLYQPARGSFRVGSPPSSGTFPSGGNLPAPPPGGFGCP
jgi:type II secretory pathway pseudopilin PulG